MKAMKAMTAVAAVIAGLAIAPAAADETKPVPPSRNNVCLWTYLIDHTTTVDKSTILFHMRNGKIWKNTLVQPCPGLLFHGFAYVTRDGQICSNMQSIMVLETHQVCMLGAFEPYTPPPKEKPDAQGKH